MTTWLYIYTKSLTTSNSIKGKKTLTNFTIKTRKENLNCSYQKMKPKHFIIPSQTSYSFRCSNGYRLTAEIKKIIILKQFSYHSSTWYATKIPAICRQIKYIQACIAALRNKGFAYQSLVHTQCFVVRQESNLKMQDQMAINRFREIFLKPA